MSPRFVKSGHRALYRRFERLIATCRKEGLYVVADASSSGAIRLIPVEDLKRGPDLRRLGETVDVDDACGGGIMSGRSAHGDG